MITLSITQIKILLLSAGDANTPTYINGIYIDPEGYAVATDGYRIGVFNIPNPERTEVFIPAASLRAALKAGSKRKGSGAVNITRTHITAGYGDAVEFAPIDSKYPNWRKVLPVFDPKQAAPREQHQLDPRILMTAFEVVKLAGEHVAKVSQLTYVQFTHNGPIAYISPKLLFMGYRGALMPLRRDNEMLIALQQQYMKH